jgi:hypothetical protein
LPALEEQALMRALAGAVAGAFAAVTGLDFFVDVADGVARLRRRWRKR